MNSIDVQNCCLFVLQSQPPKIPLSIKPGTFPLITEIFTDPPEKPITISSSGL